MSTALANGVGLVLIAFIVGWFWLIKPKAVQVQNSVIEILVKDGVYQPARIEVAAGKPVVLRFVRKDPSHCAEKVIFDKLGVSAELPLDRPHEVRLMPEHPGEYEFTCEMRMYRGRLVVK